MRGDVENKSGCNEANGYDEGCLGGAVNSDVLFGLLAHLEGA